MEIKTLRDKLQAMLDNYCKGVDVAIRTSGNEIDISKKRGKFSLMDGEQECNVVIMIGQALKGTGYKIQNERAQGLPVVISEIKDYRKSLTPNMNRRSR